MSGSAILTFSVLVVLLAVSAFFSAAETSLSSITKVRYRQIKKSKNKADRVLAKVLADPKRMLTTLLIGNNIMNIWSSSIATAFAIHLFGSEGIGIATVVMTVFILIFSEITPKTLASNDSGNLARTIAPAVDLVQRLLFPLVTAFSLINSLFIRLLQKISPDTAHRLTEDELRTMIEVGKKEGALEAGEHALLNRAFDFTDIKLREIMTARTEIAAIQHDATMEQIRELFRIHRFSRMPVYQGTLDEIQGMIHYKDLLFLLEHNGEGTLKDLLRPVLFVPETQGTFELLKQMDRHNQNMAVIIDEHGGTAGIITIDDAVAAVFGGIHDEYDTGETEPLDSVQIRDTHHLRVPGNLKLTDLNALLKTTLNSDYFETVGGFLMEQAGRLPVTGDAIRFGTMLFTVKEQSGRKIQYIDITLDRISGEIL